MRKFIDRLSLPIRNLIRELTRKRKYLYFVSFQFTDNRGQIGSGNAELYLDSPVTTWEHITAMREYLNAGYNMKATIMNYIFLSRV